ncbi:hypothetical protein ACFQX7_15415 [Luedemannella flava]
MTLLVPYHQDDFLPDLDAALPPATPTTTVTATLPDDVRGWSRLAPLYRAVADAVHSGVRPDAPLSVVSGCCGVSLGVLAGLQRAGVDAGVVGSTRTATCRRWRPARPVTSAGCRCG